jgi:hypothetical protein
MPLPEVHTPACLKATAHAVASALLTAGLTIVVKSYLALRSLSGTRRHPDA